MKKFEKLLLTHDAIIHDALSKLDNNEAHIVLVTDANRRLLGTVTDGDVRRGILKGIGLNEPIVKVMNDQPGVNIGLNPSRIVQREKRPSPFCF